ncbi:hypothetical protein [Virgisporangium aurantiacum]|uniref:Uncharacterized protein n=1 Tax=Virgisporangium aurantiacum TaxID=175570 RepID=A0A8J3ZLT5_9ACTN|nr:hypothetical protein [Virgisporangium aurantiacum]GIJ63755.1 hypothetical protein Vau01_112710 [Virgisporangium aurantiacum]
MSIADDGGWSFDAAREPAQFAAAVDPGSPGVEHALDDEQTLCSIPAGTVTVYRHLFRSNHPAACPACRLHAAAAPTRPSAQERLHDRVLAAGPGSMKDELLAALRRGGPIKIWVNGPGVRLGQHYGRAGQIVEGGPAAAAAWSTNERVGIARVITEDCQFVVVLPDEGPPSIARAGLDR